MAIELSGELLPLGSFPILDDNYLRGGYMVVDTTTDRNNIPSGRRKEGMLCYVQGDTALYQLDTDLLTWNAANLGGGSGAMLVADSAAATTGNTYNTLAGAVTAANAINGPVLIMVKSNFTGLSTGTYDFSNITLLGVNESVGSFQPYSITFTGATITALPIEIRNLLVSDNSTSAGTTCTLTKTQVMILSQGAQFFTGASRNATGAFVDLSTFRLFVEMRSGSSMDSLGSGQVFTAATGSGQVYIYADATSQLCQTGAMSIFANGAMLLKMFGDGIFPNTTSFTGTSGAVSHSPYRKVKEFTPTTLASNTDNYAPTGWSEGDIFYISASSAINLSGINSTGISNAQGSNKIRTLVNVGSFAINILHDSTSSAGYRFYTPTLSTIVLNPNETISIVYDSIVSRWRVVSYVPSVSSGTITVQEEGATHSTTVTTINYVGLLVTSSGGGSVATITVAPLGGTTAQRPATPAQYTPYWDTTIGLPIWYVGSAWLNAAGVSV